MPLVSVLMSVRNDRARVDAAVQSVLKQTLGDLELLVADDASSDGTTERLASYEDGRLRVVRNEERLGLAASLNNLLDLAGGRYVARLDSDDFAVPQRLDKQVEHIRSDARLAVVGSAVTDFDGQTTAREHRNPLGRLGVRWLALFSSPFFHPTVLVDRERLESLGLRYDVSFEESEDYDLWARLLQHADGANLPETLVWKGVHPAQASQRRRGVQESFQQRVALREITRVAPGVDAERAWRVGARRRGGSRLELVRLLRAFQRCHGSDGEVLNMALRAIVSPRRRP